MTRPQTKKSIYYNGLANVKKAGVELGFTEYELKELVKCKKDPIYFIEKYCKIISLDKGLIPFKMWEFQKRYVMCMHENRKVISMMGRQQSKTTCTAAYITWAMIFSNMPQNIALLSYKLAGSKEVLSRIKTMYENLPLFLQPGVVEWNKTSIELENGSKVFAAATSPNAVTGKSLNMVYLDEYAVVSNNIAEDFNTSVWPTLSSGDTTKLFVSSTPRGRNHFYKLWKEAEDGINGFVPFFAKWDEVPGRDEAWLKQQKTQLGDLKFARDILCTFENSANTLVSSYATQQVLLAKHPIRTDNDGKLKVFAEPVENHAYITTVDVARGTENDYSAVITIDVSVRPFEVVCVYKDNKISTELLPDKIKSIATHYNESFVIVEINDMGESVVNILYNDLEYENVFKTSAATIEGWSKQDHLGIRTTTKTKRRGCEAFKNLIESGNLQVYDLNIIGEISTFVAKKTSYAAEDGSHDDLVMALVLFSWITTQPYFKEAVGVSRSDLLKTKIEEIGVQALVMGFVEKSKDDDLKPEELNKIPEELRWMYDRRLQSNSYIFGNYNDDAGFDDLYVL